MQGLLVILGMILLMFLLPVVLPVVAFLEARDRRRRVRAAAEFGCVRCGQTLGQEGLDRGDAAWREYLTALQSAHPYSKLRVVRDVWAVCSRCGARYGYDESVRTFRLLPDKPF